jgi:hypothetical protein
VLKLIVAIKASIHPNQWAWATSPAPASGKDLFVKIAPIILPAS